MASRLESAEARARALDTFHDFELAKSASSSQLADLEGLHQLDPENEELMIELMRAWVLQSEVFSADDVESSLAHGDDRQVLYHRMRVESGFARASFWGAEWLAHAAPEVELDAPRAKLEHNLAAEFSSPEDAYGLLWLGHALFGVSRAPTRNERSPGADAAELVLKRSIALDEPLRFASAHMLLGRLFSAGQTAQLEQSRRHFTRAEALAGNRFLLTQLYHAIEYHCPRDDQTEAQTLLDEILQTDDPTPEARLQNAAAKRRAQRWSSSTELWKSCGGSR